MSNTDRLSAMDHARISVAGYRAARARRVEATQRVIAIQRFGNATTEQPQATTARLMWRASRRLAEVEQATTNIWQRMWRRLRLALRRRAR